MSAKQLEIFQGTPEWHTWRLTGLGASDVPAILGKSPYKTKRDVGFEKLGLGSPDDEDRSYIYMRGHEAEKEIRASFAERFKIEIDPTCFENGIFLASLDGYDKSLGILEAKLVGKDALKRIALGVLPEHHRIQVQSQLYSADADKAYYGAKAPGVKQIEGVEIGRDEKLIKEIVQAGEEFWDAIKNGKLPELSDQDILFITDPEQMAYFAKLQSLRVEKDRIEAQYSELDALIKSLAVHPKVRCGNVTITDTVRAGSVDYLKIPEVKALSPDYVESFRKKPSTFKTLRFGKGGTNE